MTGKLMVFDDSGKPVYATGVWCFLSGDYNSDIAEIFASEISALRYMNEQGYGKVKFVTFGPEVGTPNKEES